MKNKFLLSTILFSLGSNFFLASSGNHIPYSNPNHYFEQMEIKNDPLIEAAKARERGSETISFRGPNPVPASERSDADKAFTTVVFGAAGAGIAYGSSAGPVGTVLGGVAGLAVGVIRFTLFD